MKNLKVKESTHNSSGVWFVHREIDLTIKVYLSFMTGKEAVFSNDENMSEKWNVNSNKSLHRFKYNNEFFEVEIHPYNVLFSEFECSIFRGARLLNVMINKIKFSGKYKFIAKKDKKKILSRAFKRNKTAGIKFIEQYEMEEAIATLKRAKNINADDAELDFHLACAYSNKEEIESALYHLRAALGKGLKSRDRIFQVDHLAHLRIQHVFQDFIERLSRSDLKYLSS